MNIIVYFLYDSDKSIKIGYTKHKEVIKRINQLKTGSATKIILLGVIEGNLDREKEIHKMFKYLNINLEWHLIDESLLNFINSNNILPVYIEFLDGKLQVYKTMKK